MLPAWIIDFFQPQGVKCLRCGMAYFDELNAGLCPMCALHVSRMEPGDLRHELEHGRGELDWAAAAFRYGDGVRRRVLALKFSGARRLGEVRACAQTLYPPQCKVGARRATVKCCGRVCGG